MEGFGQGPQHVGTWLGVVLGVLGRDYRQRSPQQDKQSHMCLWLQAGCRPRHVVLCFSFHSRLRGRVRDSSGLARGCHRRRVALALAQPSSCRYRLAEALSQAVVRAVLQKRGDGPVWLDLL